MKDVNTTDIQIDGVIAEFDKRIVELVELKIETIKAIKIHGIKIGMPTEKYK